MSTLCSQCASRMEEGDPVCLQCGWAIDRASSTPSSQAESVSPGTVPGEPSEPSVPSTADTPALSPPIFAADTDLKGIGGWLIPTVIGLAVSPLLTAHGIYVDLKILYGGRYQVGLSAHPGLAGLVLFEAASNTILLGMVLYLNLLFYRTRKIFPAWMIAYLAASFFVTLIDHLWVMFFSPGTSWSMVERTFVAALIWIPYFLRSRRVQLTFVD